MSARTASLSAPSGTSMPFAVAYSRKLLEPGTPVGLLQLLALVASGVFGRGLSHDRRGVIESVEPVDVTRGDLDRLAEHPEPPDAVHTEVGSHPGSDRPGSHQPASPVTLTTEYGLVTTWTKRASVCTHVRCVLCSRQVSVVSGFSIRISPT